MSQNKFTTNNNPTLVAVSSADGETPVYLYADPLTHGLLNAAVLSGTGVVSTANSTTSNLGIGATFTGTSEDVSGYAAIQVSVFSSAASLTDGLSLQQSQNGTDWDFTDNYTIAASTGKVFSVQPTAKFFRVVYANDSVATTSLRIMTVYHIIAPNPSSQRSSDAYTNETDLTQTWSFNSVWDSVNNGWYRAQADTGKQIVSGSRRSLKGRQRTVITSSTAETTIVTAVASTFLDIYRIVVANTSATACQVDIRDATAGSIVDTFEIPANGTVGWSGPESAAANQTTVNNNWTVTCGTSVASVIVTAYFVRNT